MNVSKIVLLSIAMIAAGSAVAADPVKPAAPATSRAHGGHNAAADAFAKLDVNSDGLLSKSELAKHPMAEHASMVDSNKDGALSRTEFAALESM